MFSVFAATSSGHLLFQICSWPLQWKARNHQPINLIRVKGGTGVWSYSRKQEGSILGWMHGLWIPQITELQRILQKTNLHQFQQSPTYVIILFPGKIKGKKDPTAPRAPSAILLSSCIWNHWLWNHLFWNLGNFLLKCWKVPISVKAMLKCWQTWDTCCFVDIWVFSNWWWFRIWPKLKP